ncbi:Membrane protein [Streptomyces graminofaciens]|uniref:Membrane protein n=2 Tax=Streptomyces graminofaciens TaxID=68212 RepID=A0ABN5VJ27_9ACTN|nr:Membrane protein [Streptomyces graminofaciens]
MATGAGADAAGSAAGERPDGPKTETTLTTRVRINIPGSRPIPPVVVRKPVGDAEGASGDAGSESETTGTTAMPVLTDVPAPEPQAAAADDKPTSDWFAPRKGSAPKGAPGGGASNGAGFSAGGPGAGAPGGPGQGPRPGGSNGAGPLGGAPGGPRPGATGGPRPGGSGGGTNGAGLPGATGAGPVAPGHGGGTGSFDVSAALAAAKPERDDLPYFSEGPQPQGPTGGPVTGDSPLGPPPVPGRPGGGPAGPGSPFGGPGADFSAPGADYARPGGGISDDTAVLTPQRHAPEPGAPGYGTPGPLVDNPSGHTLTSGIPVVPPGMQGSPFGPGGADGATQHTPPKLPDPGPQQKSGSGKAGKPAKAAKPAKKKGRSKLGLLVGGVVVLGGGVYGAGLLMNHSDVPKGTTVLGVDIGGGTRDEAVNKLDEAFGDWTNKALKLDVDGQTVSLKPDQAGLQFDKQTTVSNAAVSDYNPISVIGSLFGQKRVVEPVMPVDEEKLEAALQRAAGSSGSASDGTVKFEAGKAVAVYGKAGKGIDVDASTDAVEEAYRTQVETGTVTPVKLPTSAKEPSVSKAEVDRFMKDFAEPAMSANVILQTNPAQTVPLTMSPQNSLWKFLKVKAVDGKLVDSYDEKALKELYGGTFDDVLITRANGKKTAVTVEDVYGALRLALKNKTDRTAVIETNPN